MAALQRGACFPVYLVPPLDDGAVECGEARALHNAAYADERKDERHEGKVGQLHGPGIGIGAALVVVTPSLPVFPCGIIAGISGPARAVKVPLVGSGRGGRAVMAGPAVAPDVVGLALLDI